MLVSERLKKLFGTGGVMPPFRPWISIRQDNGALLLVSPDGLRMKLLGPKHLYVSDVMSESEYFSLIKILGREPSRWPDSGLLPQK